MIVFENVAFDYTNDRPLFRGLSLAFGPGLTLLLGLNGSGKSTLLKLAAGVEKPDAGRILVEGRDLWKEEAASRRSLAYLPEQPDVTPYATIRDVIRLVCRLRGEQPSRGDEALELFDLASCAGRSIRELSQGQRRRAVFAAAMIGAPRDLLLDEPLEAMDRKIRGEILAWLERRLAEGATAVIISHDIEPFIASASAAVGMKDGRASAIGRLPAALAEKTTILDGLARGES
jgi:ABC-2 type transport system ATP-binding protein